MKSSIYDRPIGIKIGRIDLFPFHYARCAIRAASRDNSFFAGGDDVGFEQRSMAEGDDKATQNKVSKLGPTAFIDVDVAE